MYIGPEFVDETNPPCTPLCEFNCGGSNGCDGLCDSTIISTTYTQWNFVNGMYAFTSLNNTFNQNSSGSLVLQQSGNYLFNLVYTLISDGISVQNKVSDDKIGINNNGTNYPFIFNKNNNTYVSSTNNNSLLLPTTCILGDIYRSEELTTDASKYYFNYISPGNKFTSISVYNENNFLQPILIKDFMSNYCIPQNLVLAGISNNMSKYKTQANSLIYIELFGALEFSFKPPVNNKWVSSLDPKDITFVTNESTTPIPSKLKIKAENNDIQIINLIKKRTFLLYLASNTSKFIIYVYNYVTGSVIPYYMILTGGILKVTTQFNNNLLNYYFDSGNIGKGIADWFVSPFVRYTPRVIIGPEIGNLRGFINQNNIEYISNFPESTPNPNNGTSGDIFYVYNTKSGVNIKKSNYRRNSNPEEEIPSCPIFPNSIKNILTNPGISGDAPNSTYGLFTDIQLPSLFPGLDMKNNSYLFISLTGKQSMGFVYPDVDGNFPDNKFLSTLNPIIYNDMNIAIPSNNLISNLELYILDEVTGIVLEYVLTQTSNTITNIVLNVFNQAANYFIRGDSNVLSNLPDTTNKYQQFLFIAPPLLETMWDNNPINNQLTNPNAKIKPTPEELAQLPKISNSTCSILPSPPIIKEASDFQLPNSNPILPNYVPTEMFRNNISEESQAINMVTNVAISNYDYEYLCPEGQIAVEQQITTPTSGTPPPKNILPTKCVPQGICPTYNCSKCSNKSGGLDSCGFPCQVKYITDIGTELSNGTKTPIRWIFFNTNISNSYICDLVENKDGSYTLESEIDRNPSFKFVTDINDSVIMLIEKVTLASDYYIPITSIFFLNLKNGNYEYVDNPTIYFSPITTPASETNDSLSYNNDDNNCGFFGNKCPTGTVCCGQKCIPISDYNQQKCQILCPVGTINCNGKCISTDNVYSDCSCKQPYTGDDCSIVGCVPGGTPCPVNQFCYNGSCVTSDHDHCGSTTKACGSDQYCNNNYCYLSTNDHCAGDNIVCASNQYCDNQSKCVNSTNSNCGGYINDHSCLENQYCYNNNCLTSDINNCGGQGIKCVDNKTCVKNQCIACIPNCVSLCGQSDGCGGICSNTTLFKRSLTDTPEQNWILHCTSLDKTYLLTLVKTTAFFGPYALAYNGTKSFTFSTPLTGGIYGTVIMSCINEIDFNNVFAFPSQVTFEFDKINNIYNYISEPGVNKGITLIPCSCSNKNPLCPPIS